MTEGKNSQRFSAPEKAILDVDISYDGTQVLSAGNDPGIYVWSLKYQRLTVISFSFFLCHITKMLRSNVLMGTAPRSAVQSLTRTL